MHQVRELLVGETAVAYPAIGLLRPHLVDAVAFTARVDTVQRAEGYRLVGSFDPDDSVDAAAAAGFRTGHFLAWGYAMYCDDLSTRAEFRGRGHGRALIDWMVQEARRLGCEQFHLDSGVGPDRTAAHRLYFNSGMRISSHHFSMEL